MKIVFGEFPEGQKDREEIVEKMTESLVGTLMQPGDKTSSMAAGSCLYSLMQACLCAGDIPMHNIGMYAKMTYGDEPDQPIINIYPTLSVIPEFGDSFDQQSQEGAIEKCGEFIDNICELVDEIRSDAPTPEHQENLDSIWGRAKIFAAALFWVFDHGLQIDQRHESHPGLEAHERVHDLDPWLVDPLFGACCSEEISGLFRRVPLLHKAFVVGSVYRSCESGEDLIKRIKEIIGDDDEYLS